MKYLITGGAGFVGTNFAHKLLQRGDEVTLFDNFSRKGALINIDWLSGKYKGIRVVQGDIRIDIEKLKGEVEQCEVVYHLAAQVAVTTSVQNPREDFEINALGTLNLLEAIRLSKSKPVLVYASTNKVYGGMEDIKIIKGDRRYSYKDLTNGIPENRLLDFHSPYGCSKGAADQYVRDYARIYGLKTIVMRQSCIYGPRQFGVEDQGWVAWFTIASVLGKPITIYGDGKQVRDLLYVDDLFEAWDIATKKIKKVSGETFNIGGGSANTISLLELLHHLEKMSDKKIKSSFSDWRPGDQPVYISDISKANRLLDWTPKTAPEKGVERLFGWVNKNKRLLKKIF